jgi:hypothetical protein
VQCITAIILSGQNIENNTTERLQVINTSNLQTDLKCTNPKAIIRDTKKQVGMTPPNVKNSTMKDLNDSEVDAISSNELKG